MKNLLKTLCDTDFLGSVHTTADVIKREIAPYVSECVSDHTGTVFARISGRDHSKTTLLEAHIDQVGFVVTNVFDDGFVKVSKMGGPDVRVTPSLSVNILGREVVKGVFTSTPPHLAKDKKDEFSTLDEVFVDTGRPDVRLLVREGDEVVFDSAATDLLGDFITAKSLDNRAGCACLVDVVKRLANTTPDNDILVVFASGEELGNRGARVAAFDKNISEAIILDVSFAYTPGCAREHCGDAGKGAMIGVSPILDKSMTERLVALANDNEIPHQFEPMGSLTSTDADVVSVTERGIKTSLISIPIKYMHTPIETVKISDVQSVADIVYLYITQGGQGVC